MKEKPNKLTTDPVQPSFLFANEYNYTKNVALALLAFPMPRNV